MCIRGRASPKHARCDGVCVRKLWSGTGGVQRRGRSCASAAELSTKRRAEHACGKSEGCFEPTATQRVWRLSSLAETPWRTVVAKLLCCFMRWRSYRDIEDIHPAPIRSGLSALDPGLKSGASRALVMYLATVTVSSCPMRNRTPLECVLGDLECQPSGSCTTSVSWMSYRLPR